MSTRCNVEVRDPARKDTVMLYHHCDGYPSHMVPLIGKAFVIGIQRIYDVLDERAAKFGKNAYDAPMLDDMARAGKVGGVICAAELLEFEVQDSAEQHGDIEFLYKVKTECGEGYVKWALSYYDDDGCPECEEYAFALGEGFAFSDNPFHSHNRTQVEALNVRARSTKPR